MKENGCSQNSKTSLECAHGLLLSLSLSLNYDTMTMSHLYHSCLWIKLMFLFEIEFNPKAYKRPPCHLFSLTLVFFLLLSISGNGEQQQAEAAPLSHVPLRL